MKALVEDARKARSWRTNELNDEFIKIHSEILEELSSATIQSKDNLIFTVSWYYSKVKGRISYLLKGSRSSKFPRKKQKEN